MVRPLSYYTGALKTLSHLYFKTAVVSSTGLVLEEGGYKDNGNPISSVVETGMQPPAEVLSYFTANEVDCLFGRTQPAPGDQEVTQNVAVSIGYSEDGSDPEYSALGSVALGSAYSGPYRLDARVTSRMFSLKLTASTTQSLQWRGAVVHGAQRGFR
jgi:hypothetical protein